MEQRAIYILFTEGSIKKNNIIFCMEHRAMVYNIEKVA